MICSNAAANVIWQFIYIPVIVVLCFSVGSSVPRSYASSNTYVWFSLSPSPKMWKKKQFENGGGKWQRKCWLTSGGYSTQRTSKGLFYFWQQISSLPPLAPPGSSPCPSSVESGRVEVCTLITIEVCRHVKIIAYHKLSVLIEYTNWLIKCCQVSLSQSQSFMDRPIKVKVSWTGQSSDLKCPWSKVRDM